MTTPHSEREALNNLRIDQQRLRAAEERLARLETKNLGPSDELFAARDAVEARQELVTISTARWRAAQQHRPAH